MSDATFAEICREVEMPEVKGPQILERRELIDVADAQTVAIRHIANTLSDMAGWQISQEQSRRYMGDMTYTVINNVAFYLKMGVAIQTLSILLTCIWLVVR